MDVLLDEIESLEAILMDDVKIVKNEQTGIPELIETTVLPTVCDELDRQYVCITLQVMPVEGYPDVKPEFKLRNPRGLDDHTITMIEDSIKQKLTESIGIPVVFDLIDVIREHLTDRNLPSGQCVVCLYGFNEGDQFTKTGCYHYLHSYCLARHLVASKKNYQEEQDKLPTWQRNLSKPFQPVCPVCREIIDSDVEPLLEAVPPADLKNAPKFKITNELKNLQTKMANLFLHQKSRGGIIDLDADENNVISLENQDEQNEGPKDADASAGGGGGGASIGPVTTSHFETAQMQSIPTVVQQPRNNNYRGPQRGINRNNNNSINNNNTNGGGVVVSNGGNVPPVIKNNNHHNRGGGGGGGYHRNRRGGHHYNQQNNHHHHHHNNHNQQQQHQQQQSTNSQQQPCGSNPR